jgi:hypothetical protein
MPKKPVKKAAKKAVIAKKKPAKRAVKAKRAKPKSKAQKFTDNTADWPELDKKASKNRKLVNVVDSSGVHQFINGINKEAKVVYNVVDIARKAENILDKLPVHPDAEKERQRKAEEAENKPRPACMTVPMATLPVPAKEGWYEEIARKKERADILRNDPRMGWHRDYNPHDPEQNKITIDPFGMAPHSWLKFGALNKANYEKARKIVDASYVGKRIPTPTPIEMNAWREYLAKIYEEIAKMGLEPPKPAESVPVAVKKRGFWERTWGVVRDVCRIR